jgi:hypothetical protein
VGDGDVLESDVELGGTAGKVGPDALGDSFTLGDELGGVELGNDGLQDFVTDGRENALIVVGTEILTFSLDSGLCSHLVIYLTW